MEDFTMSIMQDSYRLKIIRVHPSHIPRDYVIWADVNLFSMSLLCLEPLVISLLRPTTAKVVQWNPPLDPPQLPPALPVSLSSTRDTRTAATVATFSVPGEGLPLSVLRSSIPHTG
jgi:hypothetical protein